MKKIYSFALAAVALISAASCQEELANFEPQTEGGDFTVTALASAESKTVLDGVNVYWTPGDQISLFNNEGNEVVFSTNITETSSKAKFTNDAAFDAPSSLLAIYPTRTDKTTTYDAATNTIKTLHIGGAQTAVAGSFDPRYGVAVGAEVEAGSTELQFTSINSLIKFTIGGTTVPTSVTLKNNGYRMIAGNFDYNLSSNEATVTAGAGEVTLSGSFVAGETYYIAITPGVVGDGVSLLFDGVLVKNTGVTKTLEPNKIYDLGTVEAPEASAFTAELVLAKQSHGSESYMVALGGEANKDRNIAIDGNYLYIPETKGTASMIKVSLADGSASAMPVATVDGGGTFALCCPRIIPNSDATINNGQDLLVVSSMGMDGGNTCIYVYKDGVDSDPTKLSLGTAWMSRRIGDKFTYTLGTNGNSNLWMKDGNSGALLTFLFTAANGSVTCTEAIARTYLIGNWDESGVGCLYVYPGAPTTSGIYTSTEKGAYVNKQDDVLTADGKPTYVTTWGNTTTFKGCHGFNFFEFGGKHFIAYTNFVSKQLVIIKGASSAAGVEAALQANEVVWTANIAASDNTCGSGNSGADCAVYQKNGKTYVAGHIQNVGVVVYELK